MTLLAVIQTWLYLRPLPGLALVPIAEVISIDESGLEIGPGVIFLLEPRFYALRSLADNRVLSALILP